MSTAMGSNWAYAVPIEGQMGYNPSSRHDSQMMSDTRNSVVREGPPQMARRRTSDYDIRAEATAARRRTSTKAPSVASRKRSKNTLRDKTAPEGNVDDSAWIHRDKLAQIEIREMQEAGFHVRHVSRSASADPAGSARHSRSTSRAQTADHDYDDMVDDARYDPAYTSFDDFQRKRISTIHGEDEAEDDQYPPYTKDGSSASPAKSPSRPGTSRIPMAKASAVPVPQSVVERDSPLPRSRSNSNAVNNWDDALLARRTRSNSVGGHVLLDDSSGNADMADDNYNTRRAAPPSKNMGHRSASGGRKPSASTRRSSNSNNGRPGSAMKKTTRQPSIGGRRPDSSSGPSSRPSSRQARPPEGDPPWLATMFKPDPRLPPDQQMLPTHAKRAMQEQWALEGKSGTIYGKDLQLIDREDSTKPLPRSPPKNDAVRLDVERERYDRSSPLLSPTRSTSPVKGRDDARSIAGSVRSGGLRITPMPDTPQSPHLTGALHPPFQTTITSTPMGPPSQRPVTARVPDLGEKREAKPKRVACCVVM